MNIFVAKGEKPVEAGAEKFVEALKESYFKWGNRLDDTLTNDPIREKMYEEFCESLTFTVGPKYIRIFAEKGGVKGFIVKTDTDKKFKKGDILKAAGWAAPARNFARGNVLEGGYEIRWTGAG